MIKILITGKGSYIGTHFKEYLLNNFKDKYEVDELDMIDGSWKDYDFSKYDVVYHVAGLAHKKEVRENEDLYYKVNRDLAIETAIKAKESKVKQFIFMSSMSVYGLIYSKDLITLNTPCKPNTYYGKSKLEAENEILKLNDKDFKVCVLRPPMVYGKNSPGNLTKLINLVRKVRVFPTIKNERSSITIDKLVEYVKYYIDNESIGIYLPQNDNYLCTYEVVKEMMNEEGIKVHYISVFNPIIHFLIGKQTLITKCFGDLRYGK